MGEMADDCYDRAMDEMLDPHDDDYYFSRYSRGSTRARHRGYTEPANPPPTCNRCGKTDLKWKWADAWVLVEAGSRVHTCSQARADDFDVVPDDCSDLV